MPNTNTSTKNPNNLPSQVRHLVIVLGDQLDAQSSALQDLETTQDAVWMAEVAEESTHVWSAKQRIARQMLIKTPSPKRKRHRGAKPAISP